MATVVNLKLATRAKMTPLRFAPTPFRDGAFSNRFKPLGQSVLGSQRLALGLIKLATQGASARLNARSLRRPAPSSDARDQAPRYSTVLVLVYLCPNLPLLGGPGTSRGMLSGLCRATRSTDGKGKGQAPAKRGRSQATIVWQHHQRSSGRIHRCHQCDPGSIPG
jgi:hypothetical protein